MNLSRRNLKSITNDNVKIPLESVFTLPEKVLQFGTGMLLRGLPDYFIDQANRKHIFNGRVVVVKSTSHGDVSAFKDQDGLYTVCERGVLNGKNVEENIINASISRVLMANEEWHKILECARNPEMKIIISNTTEMGLRLVEEDVRLTPPASFPGKLLAFLYERFKAFDGSKESGFVIIPTELIPDNGRVLESIVMELAHLNGLEEGFIEWLEGCNHFCSSLVDRIVTGMPDEKEKEKIFEELGYQDDLLNVTEVYNLWAIEGGAEVKEVLSFYKVNEGVKIEPDINIFRELKLRLLNATHTLSSGTAFLSGIDTVKDAMDDKIMSVFIDKLMSAEIAPSIPYEIDTSVKQQFIRDVQDRFRNPHLHHHWKTIAQNYSQKMKLRCAPLVAQHYKDKDSLLPLISFGFAVWFRYMKAVKEENGKFFGELNGEPYLIDDKEASKHFELWTSNDVNKIVSAILGDDHFWDCSLMSYKGFHEAILKDFELISQKGVKAAMAQIIKHK